MTRSRGSQHACPLALFSCWHVARGVVVSEAQSMRDSSDQQPCGGERGLAGLWPQRKLFGQALEPMAPVTLPLGDRQRH